jgi:hypothetical protein
MLLDGVGHVVLATMAAFFFVLGAVNLLRTVRNEAKDEDGVFVSAGLHVLANAVFLGLGVGCVVAFASLP